MIRRPRIAPGLLVCAECVRVSKGEARGWRAPLGGGLHGRPLEVVVLCPVCAARIDPASERRRR